jgi:hypothetical protein
LKINWVGYYPTASVGERAAFGHCEVENRHMIYFPTTLFFDYDNDGDVDNSDLSAFASNYGGNVADLVAFSSVFWRLQEVWHLD